MQTAVGEVTWTLDRRRGPHRPSAKCDRSLPLSTAIDGSRHSRETKERFRLNTELPIAFDGLGQLEVDLLCADAQVAVELDGAQHLADPEAYRRHRRKDRVLQEQGYLVFGSWPKT